MSQTYTSNDFNDILDSLVLFMRNQEEFKDMNFDGSGIRELMRVLAFNAQQQAFQNNFVYNELQLDSAQLRPNVASIASRLGYTPSSKRASKIKVNLTVTPANVGAAPASIVLDFNSQFYATKDGQTFIFSPDQAYTANLAGGKYQFTNVTLLQGIWSINGFLVQNQYGPETYVIPNSSVDTATLEVAVRTSETSADQVIYSQFKTAYDLGSASKLYFLRENRDGLYEFKFGDGKFGQKLAYGNVITARYMVTGGADGNNISGLAPVSSIGGFYDIIIDQVDARSYGGADQEDIESIRTMAPIAFASDGNAVTSGDYVGLAKRLYPEVLEAICWGGEVNVPPKYGYVFLSVIPKNSDKLSSVQKDELAEVLFQYNVGSVTPIVVDPIYTYVNLFSTVKYRAASLTISTSALQSKISNYLASYSKSKLEKFGGSLEMSKLSEFIDSIDVAISGNFTEARYEQRFVPLLNVSSSYVFDFAHKVEPGTLLISNFTVTDLNAVGYTFEVYDDNGVLKLRKTNGSDDVLIKDDLGTIDYATGVVKLNNFQPNAVVGDYAKVTCYSLPSDDQSLIGVRNSILKINDVNLILNAVTK